jgi:hypothetical protein
MTQSTPLRLALAFLAVIATIAAAPDARAQNKEPSAAAIAMANEIIEIKGSMAIFTPLIPGVVEQSKNQILQMNPAFFKDAEDIATNLRKEYAPRLQALRQDVVKLYASAFTEQELKETLAFYRSPTGKKLLTEEPNFVNRTMTSAQDWAVKLNEETLQRMRAELRKRGHAL